MADVLVGGVLEEHGVRRGYRLILLDPQEGARPESLVLERHDPAREAAGPLVLVVEPRVDAERLRTLHAGGHDGEPFVAQVLREEADAAVEEGSAEPALFEDVELAVQLGGVERVIQ